MATSTTAGSGEGIFTILDNFISNNMDAVVKIAQSNVANSISSILTASLTLYFIVYGYMVMAEKIQVPVKTLIWKLASFSIIIAFMQNSGGILTLAGQAVDQLSTIGSGGNTSLQFLDDQFFRMYRLATKLWDTGSIFTGAIGFIGVMLAWGMTTVPIFGILLISKFTLYLLLGFAPLFIFCLMWGWLKQSFNNYLTALLSNALIIIVIRTIQTAIVNFFDTLANANTDVNVALIGVMFMGVAWVLWNLIMYIIAMVSRLMATTIDQFPASPTMTQSRKAVQAQQAQQAQTAAITNLINKLDK